MQDKMWTIEDLKKMEDSTTELYRLAVTNNIPDGLARGFRRDLAIFKPEYRATRELVRMRDNSRA